MLLFFYLLSLFSCQDDSALTGDAPAMAGIYLSALEESYMTLEKVELESSSEEASSIVAYIGRADSIGFEGDTVTSYLEGPVDVQSSGYTFSSLEKGIEYTILVIAENGYDSEVKSITKSTKELNDVSSLVFPSYNLDRGHTGAVISFTNSAGKTVYVSTDGLSWSAVDSYTFSSVGEQTIYAKIADGPVFTRTLTVADAYPAYGEDGISTGAVLRWADGVGRFKRGLDRDTVTSNENSSALDDPQSALGAATGTSTDVVVLGNGGEITLTFSSPITDGDGADFAVFENGLLPSEPDGHLVFAELAYVEVSSDGVNFVRFASASLVSQAVSAYEKIDSSLVYGLAGCHPNNTSLSLGTPFDLAWLSDSREVKEGYVDLAAISYVRIVDIAGCPDSSDSSYALSYDSFGAIIYDPFKTVGTGGFDLQAVGVLHE